MENCKFGSVECCMNSCGSVFKAMHRHLSISAKTYVSRRYAVEGKGGVILVCKIVKDAGVLVDGRAESCNNIWANTTSVKR